MARLMHGVNGFIANGNGPWRITPGCPGSTHNTVRSARGQTQNGRGRAKCICPRGQDLLVKERAQRAEWEKARSSRRYRAEAGTGRRLERLVPQEIEMRGPNFLGGRCTTPGGMEIADGGQNEEPTKRGIMLRQMAKDQCEHCPLKPKCKAWVLAQEKPAGSWGGVWGGMDPWNRKGLELIIQGNRTEVVPYVNV